MLNQIVKLISTNGVVLLICLISFVLRIKGVTFQSLWLDELNVMKESDPSGSWSQLFQALTNYDIQPPLFFIIERFAFTLFGHTEFVARIISVIVGTVSVYAMYVLGKAIQNKHLGIK